jgi:hypothetical protein
MNISNTILQIMGMEIAAKLVNTTVDCETKLWRAVINTALEDVMNPAEERNSAVLKGAAHDWFLMINEVTLEQLNTLIANCAIMYEKTKNKYYRYTDIRNIGLNRPKLDGRYA